MKTAEVYPGIVGLAFISPEAIALVLDREKYTTCIYPSEEYETWLKKSYKGRKRILLMKEKGKGDFLDLLKVKDIHRIITFCGLTWMKNRNIEILDAEDQGDHIVCKQKIKPVVLLAMISNAIPYKKSEIDIWKHKGAPTAKVKAKAEGLDPDKLYLVYSLANLLHVVSHRIDETLLILPLKKFWKVTYEFAAGTLTAKDWSNRYGRSLKTTGVLSHDLKQVVLWCEKWGKILKARKKQGAVSKLDIKLSKKFKV